MVELTAPSDGWIVGAWAEGLVEVGEKPGGRWEAVVSIGDWVACMEAGDVDGSPWLLVAPDWGVAWWVKRGERVRMVVRAAGRGARSRTVRGGLLVVWEGGE